MKSGLNVCIVGAGSSYTPELIAGLIAQSRAGLAVGEVRLVDVDARRLGIMAALSQRMLNPAGCNVMLHSGLELEAMLSGADFVITQIRVGGMKSRYIDESVPLKYGLIGQETTGPGGMFKALRTIGPMLDVARCVERVCPQAFILNYTNPSGIITEAVSRHSGARIIGLCSGMPGIQEDMVRRLAGTYPDLKTYCAGLNHLGFVHKFIAGGRDVSAAAMAELIAQMRAEGSENSLDWASMLEALGAWPIAYIHYFLHRRRMVEHAQAAPRTRAQDIEEIERQVFDQAADPSCSDKPDALQRRGGGGYANITFETMRAIVDNTGAELTVSTPNRGAVEGIEPAAVVEVTCRVDAAGAAPIPVGPLPLAWRGLVLAVKAYETLTVEAAVTRSRTTAIRALMNHPLVGDLDAATKVVDEMLAAHGLTY
ncbi:MAG: 6-phospho-beta-glucosidase [Planctomycetaceae bacterium]|nr:hypothetical protein [Planctomycetaceae bacterium]